MTDDTATAYVVELVCPTHGILATFDLPGPEKYPTKCWQRAGRDKCGKRLDVRRRIDAPGA